MLRPPFALVGAAEPSETHTFHPKCGSVPNRAFNRFGLCSARYGRFPPRLSESRSWKHQHQLRFNNAGGVKKAVGLVDLLLENANLQEVIKFATARIWPFLPRPCCQGILNDNQI